MKKLIILTIILLTVTAATAKDRDLGKRNIFSVGLGVWEQDYSNGMNYKNKYGPAGMLEYERIMTHYIRVRGKFFGGGMSFNDEYSSVTRFLGLGAGVTVIPFGKKFKNLQLLVGGSYIYKENYFGAPDNGSIRIKESLGIMDFGLKFNIVDNKKWELGVLWNFQYRFGKDHGLFTHTPMVSFGLKF